MGLPVSIDPLGVVRGTLGEQERALFVIDADRHRIDRANTVLPVLRNRRVIIGPGRASACRSGFTCWASHE
ncbi:hypothetical protein [Streptomyces sp. NPDC091219]|uniref:hypothetical protein n=1 Tax=Streptomyces sp. NPDC091219 TaxID=3155193 RepID=UPI003450C2A4